jgi:hypothetical protein
MPEFLGLPWSESRVFFSSGARLCGGASKVKQAGNGVGLRIEHSGFRENWDAAADIHLSWQVKIIE